jgi:GNAT superfamily N-acetyltransferase
VCYFPIGGITRIRDLFVREEFRGQGLSKYLLYKVMSSSPAPWGVVTNTDNPARLGYEKRGFRPVFAMEAFEFNWEKNGNAPKQSLGSPSAG